MGDFDLGFTGFSHELAARQFQHWNDAPRFKSPRARGRSDLHRKKAPLIAEKTPSNARAMPQKIQPSHRRTVVFSPTEFGEDPKTKVCGGRPVTAVVRP